MVEIKTDSKSIAAARKLLFPADLNGGRELVGLVVRNQSDTGAAVRLPNGRMVEITAGVMRNLHLVGRPAGDPAQRRINPNTTIAAATLEAIEADRQPGESRGDVVDRWAADRAPKARQYRITANGADMGVYEGTTADEALNAYARDAGYRDYADALTVTSDDARAIEIKG